MITDEIKNIGQYTDIDPGITRALDYLAAADFSAMAPGRYEIDGADICAIVMTYRTKPLGEGKWEAHRDYIDIQYIADGVENIGYADVESLKVIEEYDESKDCMILDGKGKVLQLRQGSFAIFWPQDAHMPSLANGHPGPVTKIVVKVKI
jgi:biofilm protein TabA